MGPVRILDLTLFPAVGGEEQVAQDGEEPGLEVRAGLERLLLADRPQHRLLHEILGPVDVPGERDRVSPQRLQAAHEFVDEGLVHRFRVGPDDLRHPIEQPGQAAGHLLRVRIAVEDAQLAPEMGLDGVGEGRDRGGMGAFGQDGLCHRPSDVTGWTAFNRGIRTRERGRRHRSQTPPITKAIWRYPRGWGSI